MDRQGFLSQILSVENSVPADETSAECIICREQYGTTSPETGTAERKIPLPCNSKHIIGSFCITTWLQTHNTCPICRHEFFPGDQTNNNNNNNNDNNNNGISDPEIEVLLLCDRYLADLGFEVSDRPIQDAVGLLVQRMWRMPFFHETTTPSGRFTLAALCVYMSTHMAGEGRSTGDVARASGVSVASIQAAYRLALEDASWEEDFTAPEMVRLMGGDGALSLLMRLPWLVGF